MPSRIKAMRSRAILLILLLGLGCPAFGGDSEESSLSPRFSQQREDGSQRAHRMASLNLDDSSIISSSDSIRKVLYVSMAMELAGIEEAIRRADLIDPQQAEVLIVFRGLLKGDTLRAFSQRCRHLIEHLKKEKPHSITLDPARFSQHHIVKVPVLMIEDHDKALFHDLGTLRPIITVSEENLIEQIKERMKAFDYDKAIKDYGNDAINSLTLIDLPEATQAASRSITLSMKVPYDLKTPDGTLLAKTGALINPLTLPLPPIHLWVFNPLAKSQMEATLRVLTAHPARVITLIATQVDRQQGLQGIKELEKKLQHRITLMTPLLKERLGLTHVPVEIIQQGAHLNLREISPLRDPK
jgi:conjugal transfer pilus assembly protein TraW